MVMSCCLGKVTEFLLPVTLLVPGKELHLFDEGLLNNFP